MFQMAVMNYGVLLFLINFNLGSSDLPDWLPILRGTY